MRYFLCWLTQAVSSQRATTVCSRNLWLKTGCERWSWWDNLFILIESALNFEQVSCQVCKEDFLWAGDILNIICWTVIKQSLGLFVRHISYVLFTLHCDSLPCGNIWLHSTTLGLSPFLCKYDIYPTWNMLISLTTWITLLIIMYIWLCETIVLGIM